MPINLRLRCIDGFTLSVQSSPAHQCVPGESYEVGLLSNPEPMLEPYDDGTDCGVYAYVPWHIVGSVLDKHGGLKV